jgi:hypothetical protein
MEGVISIFMKYLQSPLLTPTVLCFVFPKLPQHGVRGEIGELKQIKRVFPNSNCEILYSPCITTILPNFNRQFLLNSKKLMFKVD